MTLVEVGGLGKERGQERVEKSVLRALLRALFVAFFLLFLNFFFFFALGSLFPLFFVRCLHALSPLSLLSLLFCLWVFSLLHLISLLLEDLRPPHLQLFFHKQKGERDLSCLKYLLFSPFWSSSFSCSLETTSLLFTSRESERSTIRTSPTLLFIFILKMLLYFYCVF